MFCAIILFIFEEHINIQEEKMKITQIREKEGVEALSIIEFDLLKEKIKTEIKTCPVTGLRQALHYVLPGDTCILAQKLPKVMPAAVFGRVNGVRRMKTYNGVVELSVGPLAGKAEVELVKRKAAELPQTMFAFMGSSGKSVKIWTCFTRPDGTLPQTLEEAEIFQAHAYRLAVKCYQPQIPFDIQLKEPTLEQYSRLSYDPEPFYRVNSVAFYLSQPLGMPKETTYREKAVAEKSPWQRIVPGYDAKDALALLYEAALRKTLEEMKEGWTPETDSQPLVVQLARNCFLSGIPEEEVTRRTIHRYYVAAQAMLVRAMIGNVYKECKGFGKKDGLTKEQYLALQTEEFMNRRYEFRYNTQVGEVEYRDRCSFYFRFRPLDKRMQNSILLDAQSEGIAVWDRDVDRYLHSNRVPVYNPLEDFIFHLPNWDRKDRITELAARVPCDNPHWNMLFHRWFLNMVLHWRGVDKQYANSTSPLLVGAQGTHKSTFCRDLIPPELRGYYTDSIDFSRKRDAEMYLNRFALINIDEFDQITLTQQGFLKHILQKPVVNLRKPYGNSVQELQRYASFIATSNQKDLLADPSGSRRFICIEVKDAIDTTRPIDYQQLYAQAMYEIYHGERYWFDEKDEDILRQSNREFEQMPPAIQLFYHYFKAAGDDREGEFLSPMEILDYLQKRTTISLSSGKANHFGRLLQKAGIPSRHTNKGTVYRVVKL